MSVLSDTQIAARCGWTNLAVNNAMQSGTFKTVDSPMIEPFYPSQVRTKRLRSLATDEWDVEKIVSFGLSSYGYDARIDKTFKVFTSPYGNISDLSDVVLDPKHFDDKHYQEVMAAEDGRLIIPPNGFVLGHTVE